MNIPKYKEILYSPKFHVLVIYILVMGSLIFINPKEKVVEVEVINLNCLTNYAGDYCGTTPTSVTNKSFSCIKENHPREQSKDLTREWFFLDEEIEDCTIQPIKYDGGK